MIERMIDAVGRAAAWLNLAMVAIACTVVILRYAFDSGSIFLQESVVYLHGFAFLCGLSYALKHDAHVRVDVLYARLSPRWQGRINLLGHTLLLMPLCIVIVVTSGPYVAQSWAVLEGSSEVAGVPAVFVLKTMLPVSALLLFLQALMQGLRELRKLRDGGAPRRA